MLNHQLFDNGHYTCVNAYLTLLYENLDIWIVTFLIVTCLSDKALF